jgi:Spy/CpxP family protein refolding chaperone
MIGPGVKEAPMGPVIFGLAILISSHVAAAADVSPYAGEHARPIKALSPQQVDDLTAGRGMGMALAAELNGYPGPTHAIELAHELGLTPAQRAEIERLLREMKGRAQALGHDILRREEELDRLFRERAVTEETLGAAVAAIAARQGELRFLHLRYHLATAEALTAEQAARYNALRGYAGGGSGGGHDPRRHGR